MDELPPRTLYLGRVDDKTLSTLYSGATAFVYPSLYEGFGIPPLEAMACGAPVITSNITALPEVVGDAAILVDPYDTESIASGICQVLESEILQGKLRFKGFQQAKNYTWEKTADLTWKLLQEIA